jgi:serine/threonine protein kinase
MKNAPEKNRKNGTATRSQGCSPHVKKVVGQYVLQRAVGEGTFGKVKLAVHIPTGEKVAIKILEKSKIKDPSDVKRVQREIKILKRAKHNNIVQLFEVLDTQNSIYLIMEWAECGELFAYIVKNKRIGESQACYLFHQIVNGVESLHQNCISHRDLKPENILLKDCGGKFLVKIADFGLSNTYESGGRLLTACGSPCYAPPEMIAGRQYDGSLSDIWSIGVILFAMVCGYLPFEDENTSQLYRKILAAEYKPAKWLSIYAKDLIRKILTADPKKRFHFTDMRKHVWFALASDEDMPRELLSSNDHEIIRRNTIHAMKEAGYDTDKAMSNLSAKLHNSLTATYYLFYQKHRVLYQKQKSMQHVDAATLSSALADRSSTNQSNITHRTPTPHNNDDRPIFVEASAPVVTPKPKPVTTSPSPSAQLTHIGTRVEASKEIKSTSVSPRNPGTGIAENFPGRSITPSRRPSTAMPQDQLNSSQKPRTRTPESSRSNAIPVFNISVNNTQSPKHKAAQEPHSPPVVTQEESLQKRQLAIINRQRLQVQHVLKRRENQRRSRSAEPSVSKQATGRTASSSSTNNHQHVPTAIRARSAMKNQVDRLNPPADSQPTIIDAKPTVDKVIEIVTPVKVLAVENRTIEIKLNGNFNVVSASLPQWPIETIHEEIMTLVSQSVDIGPSKFNADVKATQQPAITTEPPFKGSESVPNDSNSLMSRDSLETLPTVQTEETTITDMSIRDDDDDQVPEKCVDGSKITVGIVVRPPETAVKAASPAAFRRGRRIVNIGADVLADLTSKMLTVSTHQLSSSLIE